MKQPVGKNLIIAITLVLAVIFSSQAMALNFEFDDSQFPMDKAKRAEQEKLRAQKQQQQQQQGQGVQPNTPCWMNGTANVSKGEMEKLQAEQDAFLKATQDLRQDILSKQLILQSEIVKSTPDIQRAIALQRELSVLEAELDQKHLMHQLEMKKISPDALMGCMGKHGGGAGKMSGCPMR